MKIKFGQL